MGGVALDRPQEELLAVEIRHRFNLGHGRVDPFKVAELLGMEVIRFPVPDGSVEGIYRPIAGGRGAILVNSKSQYLRQRFTAAHEIGHSLLHGSQVFVDDELNSKSAKAKEKEADRFAGALLVDRDAAEEMVARWQADVGASVAELVETFAVNVQTAAIQLQQYGLITRTEGDSFLQGYERLALWEFMDAHDRRSPHRPGQGQLSLDRRFKRRVIQALEEGQLTPERAAEFLETTIDKLPKQAMSRRAKNEVLLDEELVFQVDPS